MARWSMAICPTRPLRDFLRGFALPKLGIRRPVLEYFTDSDFPEVAARVACALTRQAYNQSANQSLGGVYYVHAALDRLPQGGFAMVKSALLGLSAGIMGRKLTVADWRREAIHNSRMGYGFRKCFFNDYKANRSRDPRVTNRGVSALGRKR